MVLFAKSRYANSAVFERSSGERLLVARAIGPASPVIEHEIQVGDRLDHLSQHYYNDDRLWWRILDANPSIAFPTEDEFGTTRLSVRPLYFAGIALDSELEGQILLIPRAKEK
jgi:hypothetical protein